MPVRLYLVPGTFNHLLLSMHADHFAHRLQRFQDRIREAGLGALVLTPGATLTYLTGLDFHLMERPVLLVVPADGDARILLPQLETLKLERAPFAIDAVPYGEDPTTWPRQAAAALDGIGGKIGGETRGLRFLETRLIDQALPGVELVPGDAVVAEVRGRKDAAEIAIMRRAVVAAETAVEKTVARVREGMTEREMATELVAQLRAAGSQDDLPFNPIVAFGENSADPHAAPTDRKLRRGDLVLIDWGARIDGYASDLTRVFAFGEVSDELKKVAEIVEKANLAAQRVSKPGVEAGAVDRAARGVIEDAGYGAYFTHRTGHGLGLETHEEPYIRGDNTQRLEPGHAFTIEPGIYLAGKGGVRIEDDVIVTEDGIEVLSTLPRGLRPIEAA